MQINISKKTLVTILIGLASLIGIFSIFCFFGPAIKGTAEGMSMDGPSMFTFMFGGTWTVLGASGHIDLDAGLTVLFATELVIALLAIAIIAGNVSKKLKESTTICLTSILGLLTLVAAIMSFCTKSIIDQNIFGEYTKLGAGAISYGVLGIVGIVLNLIGVIAYKKLKK